MSVINSATDDQMAESDSCYVVDDKLLYQGTKRRNGKKKRKKYFKSMLLTLSTRSQNMIHQMFLVAHNCSKRIT